jgi:hypothetical protein
VPRSELVRLIASQRYGIHGMDEEHFGMAPAEMVRAGCIVWVRNGGGQVEIVGSDERLLYASVEDAVAKIDNAIADEAQAARLRELLSPQRERFSEAAFVEGFLRIVDDFLAAPASP